MDSHSVHLSFGPIGITGTLTTVGNSWDKRLFLSAPILVHVMGAAVASKFAETKNLGFLTAIVAVFWEPHRLSCYLLATEEETDCETHQEARRSMSAVAEAPS